MSEPTPEPHAQLDELPQTQQEAVPASDQAAGSAPDQQQEDASEQPDAPAEDQQDDAADESDDPAQDQQEGEAAPPSDIPDEAYLYALEHLLKGKRPAEIRKDLAEEEFTQAEIDQIMRYALDYRRNNEGKMEAQAAADNGRIHLIAGAVLTLVGAAGTAFSFSSELGGGCGFVMFIFAIVGGVIELLRGMAQSNQRPGT